MPVPTPVEVDPAAAYGHSLAPVIPLRLSKSEWDVLKAGKCGGEEDLPYELTVSTLGAVEAARLLPYVGSCADGAVSPDPLPVVASHLADANALVLARRFVPWVIRGQASRVLIHMSLDLAPPERFGPARTFPALIDYSSVFLSLERRGCEGICPAYSIMVTGSGDVTYTGYEHVKTRGVQRTQISMGAVNQLVELFRQANFVSALPYYYGASDGGYNTIRFKAGGQSYEVIDESGLRAGLPTEIANLERAIDETTGSAQWISGR